MFTKIRPLGKFEYSRIHEPRIEPRGDLMHRGGPRPRDYFFTGSFAFPPCKAA